MTPPKLTVVKVGGSLLDWPELPVRLPAILAARRNLLPTERAVLIAGGGRAADLVRALDRTHNLGDDRAHALALRALDLTSHILAELLVGSTIVDQIPALVDAWTAGSLPILAPRACLDELANSGQTPLPASWTVTSDAISAYLADALRADCLVLLKSAPLPAAATRRDAAQLGLVDPMFPAVSEPLPRVEYVNLRQRPSEPRILPP
jgi:aspartokinase-like uncharacterized kinase